MFEIFRSFFQRPLRVKRLTLFRPLAVQQHTHARPAAQAQILPGAGPVSV